MSAVWYSHLQQFVTLLLVGKRCINEGKGRLARIGNSKGFRAKRPFEGPVSESVGQHLLAEIAIRFLCKTRMTRSAPSKVTPSISRPKIIEPAVHT
jgi:hypothetical protein